MLWNIIAGHIWNITNIDRRIIIYRKFTATPQFKDAFERDYNNFKWGINARTKQANCVIFSTHTHIIRAEVNFWTSTISTVVFAWKRGTRHAIRTSNLSQIMAHNFREEISNRHHRRPDRRSDNFAKSQKTFRQAK